MKKMSLLLYIPLLLSSTFFLYTSEQDTEKQKILALIVSFHNNAFGVDHLFDQPIETKKLIPWLKVGAIVKKYAIANSTDALGIKDSSLIDALQHIENANNDLIDAIIVTYATKDHTDFLIKEAKKFQDIEDNMTQLVKQLKNTRYMYQNKKNVQSLLLSMALFIETTAKKAQKDTRMGHRSDLIVQKQAQPTSPPSIPLTPPPSQQQLIYEEEPTETPPTRRPPIPPFIPNPPTDMPPTIEEYAHLQTTE